MPCLIASLAWFALEFWGWVERLGRWEPQQLVHTVWICFEP